MSESQASQGSGLRIQLIDLAAIVVGYGLAAILFRVFWPRRGAPPALGIFAVVLYSWLGLAMSGPLLLLRQRQSAPEKPAADHPNRQRPGLAFERATSRRPGLATDRVADHKPVPPSFRTWAEMTWLVIGVYWITLGVFVLPVRLQRFQMADTILFGAVPLLAGLVFYLFGPHAGAHEDKAAWTHRAAVWLLLSWPIAWLCLIVMAEAML